MQMAYLKQILQSILFVLQHTINKEGTMKYPSININIENYIMEMGTGYMIKYETANVNLLFTMLLT